MYNPPPFFFFNQNRMYHTEPMGDNSMRISEEPQDFHKEQVAKARRTIQEHRARSLGLIFQQCQLHDA